MYNDTIKVANKIISDQDLVDIFEAMNNELQENIKISNQEKINNEKYEREYQHYSLKYFQGWFTSTINFYDDTNITLDNYNNFIMTFNNRLAEIKNFVVRYGCSYQIQHGKESKQVNQSINISIFESKMDIDVKLSSEDNRLNDVYELIKNKILNAPEKYDRIIKDKSKITSKISFAVGVIPSLVFLTLLMLVPVVRQVYGLTFIGFPILSVLLSFIIGGTITGGKMDRLYKNIVPEKKYAGYDTTNNKSIYKDDIDKYMQSSEIIIGKNIDNLRDREEIKEEEEKYSGYIFKEIIAILVMSVIAIIIGRLL